ncbi:MAG: hypothetical protein ACO1RT_13290, partial [Planctomycetaceae bacterium]
MDDSDKPKFSTAITAMLVTFGQEATAARLLGYWMGLKDLTLSQVEDATARAMATSPRLPVPADLRTLMAGGSTNDRAIAAWMDVQNAIHVSYMVDLDFEDRIINAVIRNLGGRWPFFDRLTAGADSQKWLRLDFLKAYAVYAEAPPSDEMIAPLIGQATHGEVAGRSYRPRLEVVRSDEKRAALAPPRGQIVITDKRTVD